MLCKDSIFPVDVTGTKVTEEQELFLLRASGKVGVYRPVKPGPATPYGFWVSSGKLVRAMHFKVAVAVSLLFRQRGRVHIARENGKYSVFK